MHASDRNQDATCYVGNLDPQCSEELVWELFVQGVCRWVVPRRGWVGLCVWELFVLGVAL